MDDDDNDDDYSNDDNDNGTVLTCLLPAGSGACVACSPPDRTVSPCQYYGLVCRLGLTPALLQDIGQGIAPHLCCNLSSALPAQSSFQAGIY